MSHARLPLVMMIYTEGRRSFSCCNARLDTESRRSRYTALGTNRLVARSDLGRNGDPGSCGLHNLHQTQKKSLLDDKKVQIVTGKHICEDLDVKRERSKADQIDSYRSDVNTSMLRQNFGDASQDRSDHRR